MSLVAPIALAGQIAVACVLFVVCVVVKMVFIIRVARNQRPGISRVPGPPLARWSRLWIAWALGTGRSHEIWVDVNREYGPVARIGPNHVITDDPEITRRILAARSGYVRGPWFDSVRIDPHIPNIVSERDPKKHSRIRAKLAPSFTGKSVATMEPVIDALIAGWIATLRQRFASPAQVSFDISRRIQYLTTDIITKLCLGDEIGCVRHDRDMHDVLETVEVGNKVCQYFSVFLGLNTTLFYLAKIPALRRVIFPKVGDKSGVGRLMGIVRQAVEKHDKEDSSYSNDIVSSLLSRGMPKDQIDSEVVIALVAGSDTTSTSVQGTLLSIITNPQVYKTLDAEIRAAVARGDISHPIRDAEAKQLVYLQACVLEGLRKFPPLSQLRERVVPEGGDFLGMFNLPAGTFVGLNAWGLQLNKDVYGENADLFYPERWLVDDPDQLHAMHQTHSLIFGHGSTKCLGTSIAMMEVAKVIFELLRNFEITIANPHKPWSSQCYGIFYQKDFNVRLRPVEDTYAQPPKYEHVILSDS
ncbi:benzoate 4-monooxygenase cytochrome P450 [Apiospora marii]|uniref:Benzoate 4-monooxygenase cytochrome P450 n=1 Tax=Apiospora marii TaxID=335849 RepID=A0ABR1RRH2_9PEZI